MNKEDGKIMGERDITEVKKYPTIFECMREAAQSGYALGKEGKMPKGPFGEVYKDGFMWNHYLTDFAEMKYRECWNIGYAEYQRKRGATFIVSPDFKRNMKITLQAFAVGIEYYIALYNDEDEEGMAGCAEYSKGHSDNLHDDRYIQIGWVSGFNYAREAYVERGLLKWVAEEREEGHMPVFNVDRMTLLEAFRDDEDGIDELDDRDQEAVRMYRAACNVFEGMGRGELANCLTCPCLGNDIDESVDCRVTMGCREAEAVISTSLQGLCGLIMDYLYGKDGEW